jgi:hypothetical protein
LEPPDRDPHDYRYGDDQKVQRVKRCEHGLMSRGTLAVRFLEREEFTPKTRTEADWRMDRPSLRPAFA